MKIYEAFKGLNLGTELERELKDVSIDGISISERTREVTIRLSAVTPIRKQYFFDFSEIIKREIFKNSVSRIFFEEHYNFSNLSPETIYEMNKENLLHELSMEGGLLVQIFRDCELTFSEDSLHIEADEGFLQKEKMKFVVKWLNEVFAKRFQKPITITVSYRENTSTSEEGMDFITLSDLKQMQKERMAKEPSVESPKKEEKAKKKGGRSWNGPTEKRFKSYISKSLPEDPNLFYGKNFDGEVTKISDIIDEMESVIVRGEIIAVDKKDLANDMVLFFIDLTDYTDSIRAKLRLSDEQAENIKGDLKVGKSIKVLGRAMVDNFDKELTLSYLKGIKKIDGFKTYRKDMADEKRVELHLHTVMSEMDGLIKPEKLLDLVYSWGHKAIAITDTGVVQNFGKMDSHKKSNKMKDLKIIYGMDANVVDDLEPIVRNVKDQSIYDRAVIFDIETTGFGPRNCKITEIGAVKVENGVIIDRFSSFVNPGEHLSEEIIKLTGITDEMLALAPPIEEVLPEFLNFIGDSILVAHNASFDVSFITENMRRMGLWREFTVIDTVLFAKLLLSLDKYQLQVVAKALSVSLHNHHRAVNDAEATAGIYLKLMELFKEKFQSERLADLNGKEYVAGFVKKTRPSSVTILAKNDIGRINLFRLVTISHIDHFHKKTRIKKSELLKYGEGLIFGSSTKDGELFDAILRGHGEDQLERLVKFYDFLEVQPVSNNYYLVEQNKNPDLRSKEDLVAINNKIMELGEKYGKPVVATSGAKFLNPEEEIFRKIIRFADKDRGKEVNYRVPLYLRTTDEMLEEFDYLDKDKAYEIVVRNSNLIADRIETISPLRPDKSVPEIPNSDEELRLICEEKAKEIYGEELPKLVLDRMNHELQSIIKNGFAVMYIIAQKLVWKSNEDTYLVGSRGSVGSSFVAFLAGITEVNSLPAHYYCDACKYSDFDSEEVKKFKGRSGYDMPDKICPHCGKLLIKEGHDIPFETFLGFDGDKEPDIDLNFSGEYQPKAHAYTEVIFGEGQTYRAGNISGVAEKTAFSYVLKYMEEKGEHHRRAEVTRYALECQGVRRTTGQHPGGIIVLPLGEDITTFTPIQYPANDVTSQTVTTHFDYHSIDSNLLKLDILGHDDPTMIKMLETLTGIDVRTIKFDDEKVLRLFTGIKNKKNEGEGPVLNTIGIPEFGTEFVIQMLKDTKPKSFSDLIRISGLSHGTDVWKKNAEALIKNGICDISTAVCTRDDIMTYLIGMGLKPNLSFKIMESVRKGKGLTPEWEEEMKAKNVPEWYIWSCKRIKYMFPKAHAVAYVIMGYRIAYFKIYHPLEYYTAYFSIRAKVFEYALFCMGYGKLQATLEKLKRIAKEKPDGKSLSNKEEDILRDGELVLEMYERGFSFLPLDIYVADPKNFKIIDGKIMPALITIEGLGEKAAYALSEAAKKGEFYSIQNLKERVRGLNQTTIEKMKDLGILKDLPELNQLSLF